MCKTLKCCFSADCQWANYSKNYSRYRVRKNILACFYLNNKVRIYTHEHKDHKHTKAVKHSNIHSWINYPSVQVHFTRKRNCRLMYAITLHCTEKEQNHLKWHLTALDTLHIFTDCHHQYCLLMLKKAWNQTFTKTGEGRVDFYIYLQQM